MSASGIAFVAYDAAPFLVTVDIAAAKLTLNPRQNYTAAYATNARGTHARGKYLACVIGSSVKIIDAITGAQYAIVTKGSPIWGAKWSPDGSRLAIAYDVGKYSVYDFSAPGTLTEMVGLPAVSGSGNGMNIAWSPDSTKVMLALWTSTPNYALIDVTTKALVPITLSGMAGNAWSVDWSINGHVAFRTSVDTRVYRSDTWALIHSDSAGSGGGDCTFTPDGSKLIVSAQVAGAQVKMYSISGFAYTSIPVTGQIPTGTPAAVGASVDSLYAVIGFTGGNYKSAVVDLATGVSRYVTGSNVSGTDYGTVPNAGACLRNAAVLASGIQREVSNAATAPIRDKNGNPAQRDVALITRSPIMEVGRARSDASGYYSANANFVDGSDPIAAVFFGANDTEGSAIVDWIP